MLFLLHCLKIYRTCIVESLVPALLCIILASRVTITSTLLVFCKHPVLVLAVASSLCGFGAPNTPKMLLCFSFVCKSIYLLSLFNFNRIKSAFNV